MQSLDEVKDELAITKKINQKRRVRGVLIVVNALLLAYTGYLGVSSIIDLVNRNSNSHPGDIITVLNKSETDSKKIYDEYAPTSIGVLDVATYGKYLLTSKTRVTHEMNLVTDSVRLLNLDVAISAKEYKYDSVELSNYLNEQIDLFSLSKGDYIIHDAKNASSYTTFHYTGESYFSETLYSFPNEEGRRKKIVIKGKASSPALVINVSTVVDLPSSYFDIVIVKNKNIIDEEVGLKWFENKNLKVKEVKTIKEAYTVNSSYAVNIIEGKDVYTSHYVKNDETLKPSLISEGEYKDLDSDNAIRELGGYVFNAGAGLKGEESHEVISREIMTVKTSSHVGKFTISIGKDHDNPYSAIKTILDF